MWGFNAETIGHSGDCGEMEKPYSIQRGRLPRGWRSALMLLELQFVKRNQKSGFSCEISWVLIFGNECKIKFEKHHVGLRSAGQIKHGSVWMPDLSPGVQRMISSPMGGTDGHMGDFNAAWLSVKMERCYGCTEAEMGAGSLWGGGDTWYESQRRTWRAKKLGLGSPARENSTGSSVVRNTVDWQSLRIRCQGGGQGQIGNGLDLVIYSTIS